MARIPEMVLFGIIQPVMFVVLFTYVFGGSMKIGNTTDPNVYKNFLMAGIFAQTVTFATAGSGAGIADDMQKGLIDRFRSLPMARGAVLTGRTVADLVQTSITLLVLAVVALIVGWRPGSAEPTNLGKVLAGFGLLLLLGYAFTWIGALIGLSVRTAEAATSGGSVWLFPVTFISNAFVDAGQMTPWLRHIAEWNPFSATVQACRELFGNPGVSTSDAWPMQHPVWASLIYSVLIIVVFRTLAVRKYRSAAAGRGPRRRACGAEGRGPVGAWCRREGSAVVGLGLEDRHRGHLAVRQLVLDVLADLVAHHAGAQRGLRRVGLHVGARVLPRGEQEGQRVVLVAVEGDGHDHAGRHRAVGDGRLAHLGVLEELGELAHAELLLALLLLGRVVPAVLAQVALLTRGGDLRSDLRARGTSKVRKLVLELVVRLLGQPGDVLAGLGHWCSS